MIEEVAMFLRLAKQMDDHPLSIPNYVQRVKEEVEELEWSMNIAGEVEPVDMTDACVDIIYATATLLVRLIGPQAARKALDEVCRNNLSKVNGTYGPVVRDRDGKVQKPEGFVPPNFEEIVADADADSWVYPLRDQVGKGFIDFLKH